MTYLQDVEDYLWVFMQQVMKSPLRLNTMITQQNLMAPIFILDPHYMQRLETLLKPSLRNL